MARASAGLRRAGTIKNHERTIWGGAGYFGADARAVRPYAVGKAMRSDGSR